MGCKCEICDRQTDFFEGIEYGDKCIFHCDKSDEIKWGNPESEDVKRFWRATRVKIKDDLDKNEQAHKFENCQFPIFEYTPNSANTYVGGIHINLLTTYQSYTEPETIGKVHRYYPDENNFWIHRMIVSSEGQNEGYIAEFALDIKFINSVFLYKFELLDVFSKKIEFRECRFGDIFTLNINVSNYVSFSNCIFKHAAISSITSQKQRDLSIYMHRISVLENLEIRRFKKIKSLAISELKLSKDSLAVVKEITCDFFAIYDFVSFDSKLSFINIEISNKLSIKNSRLNKTSFYDVNLEKANEINFEAVFLDDFIPTLVKWGAISEERFKTANNFFDRQVARQLKHINNAQGETVIANDFYALEMRLRSKELNWREHFGEKLVQNIHGLVSNHSNDWVLTSIWFFVFGFIFASLAKIELLLNAPLLLLFIAIGFAIYDASDFDAYKSKQLASSILAVSLFHFALFSADFEFLAALMNPLNIKDSKDLLGDTNLVLVYACRIIEVFIGYQIITAIRKNTRRK